MTSKSKTLKTAAAKKAVKPTVKQVKLASIKTTDKAAVKIAPKVPAAKPVVAAATPVIKPAVKVASKPAAKAAKKVASKAKKVTVPVKAVSKVADKPSTLTARSKLVVGQVAKPAVSVATMGKAAAAQVMHNPKQTISMHDLASNINMNQAQAAPAISSSFPTKVATPVAAPVTTTASVPTTRGKSLSAQDVFAQLNKQQVQPFFK